MTMFSGTYSGQTVLVTGHTGFKGAWLTMWLLKMGANVVGYALKPPTTPSLFESCGLKSHIEHIEGDVRDSEKVSKTIASHKPDFIFHLAASTLVRESYCYPKETFDINVMGTISVLEALRHRSHHCSVVIISTDKCYENKEWEYGYREVDPLGGHDPYSASKAAMEITAAAYRRSFFPPNRVEEHGIRLASARAGNVIGGGDWAKDRIVPDAVRALSQGEVLKVRNPSSVRPWQHVLEPLSGYLWLAARKSSKDNNGHDGSWNFGPLPTDVHTVGDLAEQVVAGWGKGSWSGGNEVGAPHESGLLTLCIDKARLQLGWEPVWDFKVALKRTVAWYKNFDADPSDTEKIHRACVADIDVYVHEASIKALAWTY